MDNPFGQLRSRLILFLLLFLFAHRFYANEAQTEPVLYHAFSQSPLQQKPIVTNSYNGHCEEKSLISQRNDARRCTVGQKHFDPCFVRQYVNRNEFICPKSPWEKMAILIKSDQASQVIEEQQLDMSRDMPWAVELTDGTRCKIMKEENRSNTTQKSFRYDCDNQRFLVGNIQRCYRYWQIYLKQQDNYSLVKLKRAWF